MAYTVNQLISGAYYASGIVSRELDTVSGSQFDDGLGFLNDILQEKVVEQDMIPYEGSTTVTAVVGQEQYNIPDLIYADTVTFTINDVRYPVRRTGRNAYFGNGRANNIDSLPFQWHIERSLGGSTLYLYFRPDQAYPVEIHGIFRLSEVAIGQDLELTLDRFYITYLRYELASRICAEYAQEVPAGVARQLAKYQSMISNNSRPLDLQIRKRSTLQPEDSSFSWGWANLGRGYLP